MKSEREEHSHNKLLFLLLQNSNKHIIKYLTKLVIMNLIIVLLSLKFLLFSVANSQCRTGCPLALASYYVWEGCNLTFISQITQTPISTIMSYNQQQIPNQHSIIIGTRINVPFSCDCIQAGRSSFLGHVFNYSVIHGDTYNIVARTYYSNLTTTAWLQRFNSYPDVNILDTNAVLNVTVNCSCGDRRYGLFATYPLQDGESLQSVAGTFNLSADLVARYNTGANASRILFLPTRDRNGNYPPLNTSTGLSGGAIAGIVVTCVVVFIFIFDGCIYSMVRRKQKLVPEEQPVQGGYAPASARRDGTPTGLTSITVDKSVEFSYEELANATDDFSIANKIGEGGFGAVYYAELRGEKAAIKKMDKQASKEFLAELKVLTHVHHLNLVHLIGYCVEGSLFLVYEYIENGNLGQNLRGSGREPLPWSTRVQIALDSARGLEYIHEHTVPMYIHRDIKPENILIDNNFHGKVADFGLTKLIEVGSNLMPTSRLVGTFGYMPPEYGHYSKVSPKVDVYAFGVVLYELISAKEAIVNGNIATDPKGLVALFDEVLKNPNGTDELQKLIDPRLGDNYPFDSVLKMAQLARVCTHENPQLRPSMRSIVIALITLSSTTEDWDVESFYGNQCLLNLMSGR